MKKIPEIEDIKEEKFDEKKYDTKHDNSRSRTKGPQKARYTINNYIYQYYTIKQNDECYKSIANKLDKPKMCLLEWIQEYDYLKAVKGSYTKINLEGAGRIPELFLLKKI